MKRIGIILISTLIAFSAFANINYIDISKITKDSKLITAFNFIKNNQKYFDHWTHEWRYDVSKEELIKQLKDSYSELSSIPNKSEELYLLLGDIGYYLFNLDENPFSDTAVHNFELAMKSSPKDYRPYWFLGNHYALSNHSDKAIDNYFKGESLLPTDAPADFWNDYAAAAGMANMPSHCFFAMDKVKSITGMEGSFEAHLGPAIYKRMIDVCKDSSFDDDYIWSESLGEKATFISRPLGIKFVIDSAWKITVTDYANHQSLFNMKPLQIKNKDGNEIKYTIQILSRTVNDTERLEPYVDTFVSKFPDRKKITFSQKYDKMIAYEIRDKTVYQNIGGRYSYVIAIEREAPKYPGLLLEAPATIPNNNSGQGMQVYRAQRSKKRFDGKIFYMIMLDSCEDIYEQSYSVFKTFFDNQLIIE
ncbi:MAG TPA: hypothetical protein VK808_05150 [Bacteroidia bacterium]|jgi:hypothetical protein|nr:hypothetical protein [Bacteroidia bacterium]